MNGQKDVSGAGSTCDIWPEVLTQRVQPLGSTLLAGAPGDSKEGGLLTKSAPLTGRPAGSSFESLNFLTVSCEAGQLG